MIEPCFRSELFFLMNTIYKLALSQNRNEFVSCADSESGFRWTLVLEIVAYLDFSGKNGKPIRNQWQKNGSRINSLQFCERTNAIVTAALLGSIRMML